MQDNEFEKQVHQKLAHMQMDASDTVWERVADGLDGKRKRRRWFIWLPIGTAAILVFALLYMNVGESRNMLAGKSDSTVKDASDIKSSAGKEPGIEKSIAPDTVAGQNSFKSSSSRLSEEVLPSGATNTSTAHNGYKSSTDIEKERLATAPDTVTGQNFAKGSSTKKVANKTTFSRADSKPTAIQPTQSGAAPSSVKNTPKSRSPLSVNGNPVFSRDENSNRPAKSSKSTASSIGDEKATSSQAISETTSSDGRAVLMGDQPSPMQKADQKQREINPGLIRANPEMKGTFFTDSAVRNAAPGIYFSPAKLAVVESSWRWGITVAAGRSGITTGKLNTLFYSDAASVPNYSAGNLGNTVVVARPSQINPGLSLSIGSFAEKQLEKNVYLKAGLQSSRFTTKMQVGRFQAQSVVLRSTSNLADKSIESYYTAETNQRYVNAYSYLDVPVLLGINIAQKTRLPFAWEFGLSPSLLLGTNALHFNQGSSIYYKDKSLFKKTQMAFITALPVKLYNGNRYALILSPSFRYNMSDLFRPELAERKHLLAAGVGLSLNFKK